MNWLTKLVVPQAVKLGVAYAIQTSHNIAVAIRAVIAEGNLPDSARATLVTVISVVVVVHDFLVKVAQIIGSPEIPAQYTSDANARMDDAAKKLRRIVEGL
jgi:hypothetical protein